MKQIDNYSQIVSWAKLWFNGSEKKCQENAKRESDIRSRLYFDELSQQKREQQLVLHSTFQKFKQFKIASLKNLIQIQNMWKQLNQPASRMDQLLLIQHKKLSKKKLHSGYQYKRKPFASSTIVYTQIHYNQNHVTTQILPVEHQLLLQKGHLIEEDDDDNIPLGDLIKS